MSALEKTEPTVALSVQMQGLSPEYAEIMVLGGVLQKSGYFKDVRDQAQAVTKILFGRELGFSPIVSMGGIHIIEGKPALSSNLMATLIKRSGKYDYRVKSWTTSECVLTFRQKENGKWEEVGDSAFTTEDAKAAGVFGRGSWSKYPKAMFFARALSQGLRTYCPEVSAAPIYNPEEMGATVNEEGDVTELPASAKIVSGNVKRITEDIQIDGPVKNTAVDGNLTVKGEAGPEKAVVQDSAEGGTAGQSGPAQQPSVPDSEECIGEGEQKAIHIQFKKAIRNPEASLRSDDFLYDWLEKQGYKDPDGKGTTKTIPKYLFQEVKAGAVKFAAGLPK